MSISSLSPVYISPKTFYSTPPSIITGNNNNNVPYVPYYLDSIRHVTNEYKNIVEKDRNLRQKLHCAVRWIGNKMDCCEMAFPKLFMMFLLFQLLY